MTIYVLESHPLTCQALTFLVRSIDPCKSVVGVYSFSKLQESLIIGGQPEAFILDPIFTGINGTAGIKLIKDNYPDAPIIIFSSLPRTDAESSCINAGADLFIEKTSQPKEIFDAIKTKLHLPVANNESPLTPDKPLKLSKRQKDLLALVNEGLSNDDIASRLGISPHTVKVHLWRFYKKLGIASRTQLIKFSRENGYF